MFPPRIVGYLQVGRQSQQDQPGSDQIVQVLTLQSQSHWMNGRTEGHSVARSCGPEAKRVSLG